MEMPALDQVADKDGLAVLVPDIPTAASSRCECEQETKGPAKHGNEDGEANKEDSATTMAVIFSSTGSNLSISIALSRR